MYVDKDKNGKYSIMDISEEEMQLMDVAFSSKGRDCLDEAIFYGDSKSLSNEFYSRYMFYDRVCKLIKDIRNTEPMTVENYKAANNTEL